MLKIDGYKRKGPTLLSVTVQVDDEKEVEIYHKFLEGENICSFTDGDTTATVTCPTCGKIVDIDLSVMRLRVDNPLSNNFGMALATPEYICAECKKEIPLSMVDYTAFPSVIAFIKLLKQKEQERKASLNGPKKRF